MRNLGLSLTFWLAGILLSTNSFALGLGEIEVNSFLNQPLEAKIEVISARSGEIDNLLVTLASQEAFTRAGLSRPRSLAALQFAVQVDEETATAVVLVTTKSAVKEPFLNFLVEADWAKGRVLREFTVLLDPPFYANTPAPAPSSNQGLETSKTSQEASTTGVIAHNEPTSSSETSEQSSSDSMGTEADVSETSTTSSAIPDASLDTQQSITEQQSFGEPMAVVEESATDTSNEGSEVISDRSDSMIVGELQVHKGDTLWSIATQFQDSRHSMSQVMLALQQMNPDAFGDNNINFLKIGSVLRAPGAEQLDSFGKQEAIAEVLEQNGLWDGYVESLSQTTGVSMAGDGGDSGVGDTAAEEQSNLSLLTPGENESDTSGVQGDEESNSRLSAQLALAEEELDAARIENSELESRISELEATLSKVQELQRMVEIEDDSMAQLQANQNEESAAVEAEEMEQASLETITVEPTGTTEALTEEMNSVDEEALLEELLAEDPDTVTGQTETDSESEGLELEPLTEATQTVEPVEEQTTVPAPVIISEPKQISGSFLDGILPALNGLFRDPLLLGGVGGILILLLGLFGYKKWQSKQGVVDLGESDAGEDSTAVDDDAIDGTEIDDDPAPFHTTLEEAVEEAIQAEDNEDTNIVSPNAEEMSKAAKELVEEDSFSTTEIFAPGEVDEALTRDTSAPVAEQEDEVEQQDDTLNEVDVYLAYGLYDNAEELLKQSLEASPNRADYRSKLLDTYFATKNITEFVKQAETLKGMGEAAGRHWDRVQVMGYELAPDNALFSGAKDSTLSATDLGIAKPEVADFDLGSGEEAETHFGEDDFLLSEGLEELDESDALADNQNFVETLARENEVVEALESTPASAKADDDLSDLEFAIDVDDEIDIKSDESDGMDFDLPDDMVDADIASDVEEELIDFDIDEALNLDEEEVSAIEDDDEQIQETIIIAPGAYPELDEMPGLEDTDELEVKSETLQGTDREGDVSEFKSEIEDIPATGDTSLGLDDVLDFSEVAEADLDDQTDISEIDLGIDDISAGDPEIEINSDDFNVDLDGKPTKTDTFAPGDFDDPEEILPDETNIEGVNIDDIDDLVLPDDVDEVSTKLDLARAFIDMGDSEGARSSLEEVMSEGNDEQKAEAETLMKQV